MTQRSYTLSELASVIEAKLQGDPNCIITGIATLQSAQSGQISFLDNPRYRKYLATTQASCVILAQDSLTECSTNALITNNPYLGFAKAAALFAKPISQQSGIHPTVVVGEGCQIHPSASLGPYCVIGKGAVIGEGVVLNSHCVIGEDVQIGAHSHFYPHVTLYHDVKIGQRVIIHSGAIIGSDGFGFAPNKGAWHKVPQLGGVVIGDDVEIGANTTIDCGALADTVIETGVKLDNQIQIGHNVHIGAHSVVAGCVGISGSTTIGKYCMIGGGAGIAGHLEIVDKVIVSGMSRVSHSIHEPGVYSSGSPLQTNQAWRKNSVRMRQLDDMARRIRHLEKIIEKVKAT